MVRQTKVQPARLNRTSNTYEFFVRYPYGSSVIRGYRRAARHFGLHTLHDPTFAGSDGYRLLIHKSAKKLREAARVLGHAYAHANETDDETLIDEAEFWLEIKSGVHWFSHDWKHWDQEQDEGALEHLGWRRVVVEEDDGFRITLQLDGKRDPGRRSRPEGTKSVRKKADSVKKQARTSIRFPKSRENNSPGHVCG
jgi:hypothetical protein